MSDTISIDSSMVENNKLIVVEQLPIISQKLKNLSSEIDNKITVALEMPCTEETVKNIKKTRAELNKDLAFLEEQRKRVKNEVMKPYEDFEVIYKQYAANKYKDADLKLKNKIDDVEKGLKLQKETEVKDYFNEYLQSKNIDFVTYDRANINVTLSASLKSLKDQAKGFIDKVFDDLVLIETQEHSAEILVEYKASLNASKAITTVTDRYKQIEEMKSKKAEQEARRAVQVQAVRKVDSYIEPPKIEPQKIESQSVEEQEFTLAFKVTASKSKLIELKNWLNERGYKYE